MFHRYQNLLQKGENQHESIYHVFFWVESSRNFIFLRGVLLLADSSLFVLQKKYYYSTEDNNITVTVVKLFNFRAPLTLLLQRTFPMTTCIFLSALKHLSF